MRRAGRQLACLLERRISLSGPIEICCVYRAFAIRYNYVSGAIEFYFGYCMRRGRGVPFMKLGWSETWPVTKLPSALADMKEQHSGNEGDPWRHQLHCQDLVLICPCLRHLPCYSHHSDTAAQLVHVRTEALTVGAAPVKHEGDSKPFGVITINRLPQGQC
jgi:hypothetical protein